MSYSHATSSVSLSPHLLLYKKFCKVSDSLRFPFTQQRLDRMLARHWLPQSTSCLSVGRLKLANEGLAPPFDRLFGTA
ncbi:hypothetical protein SAY87_007338 [Trapa incisa]|uniref:Uncharacterized protein n=1 Tax=Trapa incisa TaxID=236973 RepID=A0AAN7K014_9MYRT|nr:hypothetical protein SAY87_007338 [Trapa incisa]